MLLQRCSVLSDETRNAADIIGIIGCVGTEENPQIERIQLKREREWDMNKEWSELNKTMQAQIKKKDTYKRGIDTLLTLRSQLIQTLVSFKEELCREDFNSIPFINADGYHSKTIAYSIWHIFRIEDIVVHTVINEDEQVFFAGNYQERINSPIITTGNELVKEQIADFSKQLNLKELYSYIVEVEG